MKTNKQRAKDWERKQCPHDREMTRDEKIVYNLLLSGDILNPFVETDIDGKITQWVKDNPKLTATKSVNEICKACVGGVKESGFREKIRTCKCFCPIHKSRPYIPNRKRAVLSDIRAYYLDSHRDDFGVRNCDDFEEPGYGYRFATNPRYSDEARQKQRERMLKRLSSMPENAI